MNELICLLAESKMRFNANKAYILFEKRIASEHKKSAVRKMILTWSCVACISIPLLFLIFFTYKYFNPDDTTETTLISEIITPNGSKTQLTLQDGTKIWMNSGSKLECSGDFGKKSREIKLNGEAYLEVAHRNNCPFIVSTGELKVKVLGTRFNVNAYKENNEIKVALLEGSVEMIPNNIQPILLSPGNMALYNTESHEIQIHPDATDHATCWINNKLFFDGETFEQIMFTLERNFNIKININNVAIKDHRYVGDFVNNESIEDIFRIMSSDDKFYYKINGNKIDVY